MASESFFNLVMGLNRVGVPNPIKVSVCREPQLPGAGHADLLCRTSIARETADAVLCERFSFSVNTTIIKLAAAGGRRPSVSGVSSPINFFFRDGSESPHGRQTLFCRDLPGQISKSIGCAKGSVCPRDGVVDSPASTLLLFDYSAQFQTQENCRAMAGNAFVGRLAWPRSLPFSS